MSRAAGRGRLPEVITAFLEQHGPATYTEIAAAVRAAGLPHQPSSIYSHLYDLTQRRESNLSASSRLYRRVGDTYGLAAR
jgi:hypothetical protein